MLCPCCAAIQEHNELDSRGATQWNPPPKDHSPIIRNGMVCFLPLSRAFALSSFGTWYFCDWSLLDGCVFA
jgi:hypothetical protein